MGMCKPQRGDCFLLGLVDPSRHHDWCNFETVW